MNGSLGHLGGAANFRSWIRFAFFFFIVWGAPTGFTFPFMVDGVAFQNAFSFLEVNFFRDSATCRRCVDQGRGLKSDVVKCDVFKRVLKRTACSAEV